jgi:NDP-sugar pyrophosphorylase family protein
MRAIILAGGYAKRMGQLAAELPKSLLPVAGRPAIEYIMDRLNEIALEKVLLTTNLRFKTAFESWLASKPRVAGSSSTQCFPTSITIAIYVLEPASCQNVKSIDCL